MQLKDITFSDLILSSDGHGWLKGCKGTGQQLVPIPPECHTEIAELPTQLSAGMINKKETASIRLEHNGVRYRASFTPDVMNGRSWFLRRLAEEVPDILDLGIGQKSVIEWLVAPEQRQGLILVAGAQASGKTTTASSLVASRLRRYGGHAVTFENPAELPLNGPWGEHGFCFQTEIDGEEELSRRIERAHTYASPDIIYIGEIKTQYAAQEALRIALGSTRQLVVATIHGLDVIAALQRLLNWAEQSEGSNARMNLGTSLLAVLHLELEKQPEKTVIKLPGFLLLPFTEKSKSIRSKIKNAGSSLNGLEDDMRELRGRIMMHGIDGINQQ